MTDTLTIWATPEPKRPEGERHTMELTNRMLAEAAGWVIELHGMHIDTAYYMVTDPSGNRRYRETAYGKGEAWPEWELEDVLPDYLHDADAALSLLPRDDKWHIYYTPDKGYAVSARWIDAFPAIYYETLEEAVCRAGMAYAAARARE